MVIQAYLLIELHSLYFFFSFFIYDRNPNLNSHTPDPKDRTHTLIERWDSLGREITTKPNAQVAIELHSQSRVHVEKSLKDNFVLCRWDVQGTICKFNSFKYRLCRGVYSINCKVMDL